MRAMLREGPFGWYFVVDTFSKPTLDRLGSLSRRPNCEVSFPLNGIDHYLNSIYQTHF